MKKWLKKVKYFLKTIVNCAYVVVVGVFGALLTLIRGKRTIFSKETNESAIILGNGPSLNDIDLDAVSKAGLEIVCVNSFPSRNANFERIKPKYLVLLDPVFFMNAEQLGQEEIDLFEVLKKVDWKMHVLIPQGNSLTIENENLIVDKICTSVLHSEYMTGFLDWFYRRNLLTFGYQNVVIGAGFYFVSKRVKRLYYAGIDMSEFKQLFVDDQNRVYIDKIHNYGSERCYSTLFNKGEFYKLLKLYQIMFEQFSYLKKYADRQQVEIINLSINSYVDVFEKSTMFHRET